MGKLPEAPDPAALGEVEPDVADLAPGTEVWRIYFRGGKHPTAWNEFRSYGPLASARFDHHDPPASHSAHEGVLYGALGSDAFATCVAEVFQENRVADRYLREPWLAVFGLEEKVPLLTLRGKWPTRAGASMGVSSDERRELTRGWSRAIHAAYPQLAGILYASSMNSNEPAVALYERALGSIPARPRINRPLSDPALEDALARICRDIGYDYP